jgi:NAD-dependent deacetylase
MGRDEEIAELRRLIAAARRIVIFTGAGISTESGIPDFRSPGGIWTRRCAGRNPIAAIARLPRW